MKMYGAVEVYLHVFLTSAVGGGECLTSLSGRFNSGENSAGLNGSRVAPHTLSEQYAEEINFSPFLESNLWFSGILVRSL
jgi:hypothetical protein